jgi:hypothetical protein
VPRVTEYRAVVNASPAGGIDARADRAVQSTVGILLLAAFVFGIPVVVPVVCVALFVGAIFGPRANPLHLLFAAVVARRVGPATAVFDPETVRRQDALVSALCAIGTLFFAIDVFLVGWLFVVAAALVAIIAATTHIHLGDQLQRFTHR